MSLSKEQISSIEAVDEVHGSRRSSELSAMQWEAEVERVPPDKERFDALMTGRTQPVDQENISPNLAADPSERSSSTSKLRSKEALSPVEMTHEIGLIQHKVRGTQELLAQADVRVKPEAVRPLRHRLERINERLDKALEVVGVDFQPPEKPKGLMEPVQHFLSMLTQAQSQLQNVSDEVNSIHGSMSPAAMLKLQMKMGIVNQQVELFSNMLNKSLETMKTVLNVQV